MNVFERKSTFVSFSDFLSQRSLSSFLVFGLLEKATLTRLSYIKTFVIQLIISINQYTNLFTSTIYQFDIKVSNVFLGVDSN